MSPEEFKIFRNICVEIFLMTDPQYHFEILNKFKALTTKHSEDDFH